MSVMQDRLEYSVGQRLREVVDFGVFGRNGWAVDAVDEAVEEAVYQPWWSQQPWWGTVTSNSQVAAAVHQLEYSVWEILPRVAKAVDVFVTRDGGFIDDHLAVELSGRDPRHVQVSQMQYQRWVEV